MGALISTISSLPSTITTILKTLSSLNTQYQSLLHRTTSTPGIPIPNPTSSYWQDSPPFPNLTSTTPALLPSETDIVIIGSGITSVSIARTLLSLSSTPPPPRILVCEARTLCSGATGRNGGHIKCVPYEVFASFKAKLGPERAREVVRFQRRHLGVLLEVGKVAPEGEAREVETVDLFLERSDFESSKVQVEECRTWVPEVDFRVWEADEAREKFGVNSMVAGAISYTAGALWPYRLVTSLWNDLLERYPTLTVSTHTAVTSTTHSPSSEYPYTLETSRGSVKARHVIHATNAFASHLIPSLRPHLTGALAHMSAQRPGTSFPPSHGQRSWSVIYRPGFDYVTQRPDGSDGSPGDLMVGGGFFRSRELGLDQIGVWDDSRMDALPLIHVRGVMGSIFEPRWGAGSEVKKAWTGILGVTGDQIPLVGRLPTSKEGDKESGEWIAAGFNGEGMVWAWLCGTALAIMVLGKEDEMLTPEIGRPGGKLEEWFPRREFELSPERLKRADLRNLASEVDELGR